jgi:hypothetical protein
VIVSHRHKFIFVKTRKTAGTSLEIGLSQHCGPDDVITPVAAEDEELRAELGFRSPQNTAIPARWTQPRQLLRAALGRIGKFYNHMPAKDIRRFVGEGTWDDYFTFTIEREPYGKAISRYYWSTTEPRPTIDDYLRTAPVHLISNWGVYTINDTVAVDFVIRFERLAEDIERVRDTLGLAEITMPRAKGGYRKNRAHYSEVLGPAARERIELVCAKEIKHFGYGWRSAPT